MTRHEFDNDFAAIAVDDVLVDQLALGAAVESDDELAHLLTRWRKELDEAVEAVVPVAVLLGDGSAFATAPPRTARRRRRLQRHTAGVAAAAVVALAGSAGVAAAATGPHGPLGEVNRVLFGAPARDDSVQMALVRSILDRAERGIDTARAHGGASAARLADLDDQLDTAGRLLAADRAAPSSLTARLAGLRVALAALTTLPTRPPVVVSGTISRSGGGTVDRSSGSGHDGGGSSHDSSTSSGDGSGGTSGTDGGTSGGSGSDGGSGSGSDGGTSTGGGTTSGSTSGSGGSDGGTSGGSTSSDGGSTSGSDGGGSGSGSDG